jgi:hypothetical protein
VAARTEQARQRVEGGKGTVIPAEQMKKNPYTTHQDDLMLRVRVGMSLAVTLLFLLHPSQSLAQGGPPYYTTDPGTPGGNSWEINLGYMPFRYNGSSISHIPDADINYGIGDRIQLTLETAWLRGTSGSAPATYGVNQDQWGIKWRFYDDEETGLGISLFPQLSVNTPFVHSQSGLTPPGSSLLLPMEFTKKVGPVDVNWEVGYNKVWDGFDGWEGGLVVGHDVSKAWEIDAEFYGTGTWSHGGDQDIVDVGARYKIRPPFILLLMAGRSVERASSTQPSFVGYFGMQFLFPVKPFDTNP